MIEKHTPSINKKINIPIKFSKIIRHSFNHTYKVHNNYIKPILMRIKQLAEQKISGGFPVIWRFLSISGKISVSRFSLYFPTILNYIGDSTHGSDVPTLYTVPLSKVSSKD